MNDKEKLIYWKKIFILDFIFIKILLNYRRKMVNIFFKETNYKNNSSLLDIGTTSSCVDGQNLLLDYIKKNKNVTCISNQNIENLRTKYKNIRSFITGDAKKCLLKITSLISVIVALLLSMLDQKKNKFCF